MARVLMGTDEVLGRAVAVKILRPGFAGSEISDRFRREGRTSARLSHPNIVQVYDAGEDEFEGREISYIVMEYVPGGDLKELIDEKGPLSDGEISRIGAGAAAALDHAHGRGVVHRDVKPHNILLDDNGSPRLTDFGIARALDATQVTRTGTYLGTAAYSSPEQLRGEKATAKSDVYSLGITLYQAATGEQPFSGSPVELADRHATEEPLPPRETGARVGEKLETLILACLAKDPDSRPTAGEVRDTLMELYQPVSETRAQAVPEIRKPAPAPRVQARPENTGNRKRARGVFALLALLILVALAGIALAVPNLLGGGGNSTQGKKQDNQPSISAQTTPRQEARRKPSQKPAQKSEPAKRQETVAQQNTSAPQEQPVTQVDSASGLTTGAAEKAVKEMYSSAAAKNYNTSYSLLSGQFKQDTVGSEANWAATFDTLQSIKFIQGPTAVVNGDTATVTGTTIAVHTDRVERNTGTWTLVDEGGEWKVNDVSVQVRRI